MAPLCKVTLAEPDCLDSGPYSMLFLDGRGEKGADATFVHSNQQDQEEELDATVVGDLNETIVVQDCLKRTYVASDETFPVDKPVETTFLVEDQPVKSCELYETFVTKRRRIDLDDTVVLSKGGGGGGDSVPSTGLGECVQSTPLKLDLKFDLRSIRLSSIAGVNLEEEKHKRDSLECEESWGILTPDQMVDDYVNQLTLDLELQSEQENVPNERRTSSPKDFSLGLIDDSHINNVTSRYSGGLINKLLNSGESFLKFKVAESSKDLEVQSPNVVDASVTEYSLGILDEHVLSNLSTMNLALPLENVTESKDFRLSRLEQTPSPEDLPLDPTPVIQSELTKDEVKAKPPTSFITSITSITSLDTGYQGDGEMSRPASRGPDNSPITRRPLPKPQNHRQDPMTDSDFYTESDADNHEEAQLKGDRKAQVIDGTLYGVDAQTTADIYTNNRENMDSSGIFTDVETNTKAEDVSPSDTSTKTISENSQKTTPKPPPPDPIKKRVASSPASPVQPKTPGGNNNNKTDTPKKYKMPKRDVASKVKAMIVPNPTQTNNEVSAKKTIKKTAGRWDSVMNKISKNEQNKSNLKEVKSKVFNSVTPNNKTIEANNKINARQSPSQKTPNTKLRRTRTRTLNTVNSVRNAITLESSIHSSLSDVSSTAQQLSKKNNEKKKLITPPSDAKTKKYQITPREKEKKPESPKISETRNNVKPARQLFVGPSKRSQTNFKEENRIVEALAILVQHLVFNVEAFSVPTLKREIRSSHLETEEWKKSCHELEETLKEEKNRHLEELEKQEVSNKQATEKLIKEHEKQILEFTTKQQALENDLKRQNDSYSQKLKAQHEEQLAVLKSEFSKLQVNYEERLDILREENEAIREQIDEKKSEVAQVREEARKLRREFEVRELQLKEKVRLIDVENQRFVVRCKELEEEIQVRTGAVREENLRLREENDRLLSYGDKKGIGLQEVQSLRAVLELKQTEVAELRKTLAEATQRLEVLELAEERANASNAKCEDLLSQLHRKQEYEQSLINENVKLQESFREENKKNARLNQHNEELQWKLQQNKEIIGHILEQTGDQSFNRSLLNSSLNEKHTATKQLERSLSLREPPDHNKTRSYKMVGHDFDEEESPPASPKVKGVVEKSDSVSYVLDLDESPDIVASRIVRRSFRNSTPPKTTPTKSPTNKTPKNSLSLSSSTSSMTGKKNDDFHFKNSNFIWQSTPKAKLEDNSDLDDEEDLQLPALPSELNRQTLQALPTPKHLAGEAMISESASEDESTSSSQL